MEDLNQSAVPAREPAVTAVAPQTGPTGAETVPLSGEQPDTEPGEGRLEGPKVFPTAPARGRVTSSVGRGSSGIGRSRDCRVMSLVVPAKTVPRNNSTGAG